MANPFVMAIATGAGFAVGMVLANKYMPKKNPAKRQRRKPKIRR